jgi:hypothetical protein
MLETINELLKPKPEQKKPTTNKPPEKKPQTKTTPTPQNKDTNIKAPSKINYVDKSKVLGEANTLQSPFDELNLKTYFDSLNKSLTGLSEKIKEEDANVKKTQQEVLAQISSEKGMLEKAYEQMDEQLKQANDIPTIKTYKEIVEENNKLMPLMVGVIALGTAIFGNKDGTTMADKMNAMFGALKEKSLTDWKTATEEFKLKLQQWKAKSENIYNRVNVMMQKLMLGEKIDDELAKFKVDFANTNLNTVTALYKQSSETLQKLAEMITNAQYKTSMLYFNKQRADASTKEANLKEKQYNQKQQDEAEKKKIKQEANHAAAEYDKAKARGDKKAMAYWRARYTELTGQEPPGEKSSSSKSVIGTPSLNFDTTLLTQEK